MKLVIRTSSVPYAIGLFDQDHNLSAERQAEWGGPRQSALGGLLQECLREVDQSIDAVSEIIVDLGPGGLSSTRVGVSFANALSYGRRLKLFGVSALRMQMYDVMTDCRTPILSMRPATGGQSIWALFDGSDLKVSGFSFPDEAIAQQQTTFGKLTVVGPLNRLNFLSKYTGVHLLNVESPSLESMLNSPKTTPRHDGNSSFLEPITSADGASR